MRKAVDSKGMDGRGTDRREGQVMVTELFVGIKNGERRFLN